jgi:hypothetical protein
MLSARRISVPSHIRSSRLGHTTVILNPVTELYLGLDEVASRVWDSIVNDEGIEAAITRLLQEYAVDEQTLRKDIENFLAELQINGLISIADLGSASPEAEERR